jgi:hypothetical protein
MSERCIKRDRNYSDNFFLGIITVVVIAVLFIWGCYAWHYDWGMVLFLFPLFSIIVVGLLASVHSDNISKKWSGIGYYDKTILPDGIHLMFDTRSYDDYKFIFEHYLSREGLEFTSERVSIMYAIITVTLKRDIDYLKLIGCIEEADREISLSFAESKLMNKNVEDERQRMEHQVNG